MDYCILFCIAGGPFAHSTLRSNNHLQSDSDLQYRICVSQVNEHLVCIVL